VYRKKALLRCWGQELGSIDGAYRQDLTADAFKTSTNIK